MEEEGRFVRQRVLKQRAYLCAMLTDSLQRYLAQTRPVYDTRGSTVGRCVTNKHDSGRRKMRAVNRSETHLGTPNRVIQIENGQFHSCTLA